MAPCRVLRCWRGAEWAARKGVQVYAPPWPSWISARQLRPIKLIIGWRTAASRLLTTRPP